MSGVVEIGQCSICKKISPVNREYYTYNVKCECHNNYHSELVYFCSKCTPKEPSTTAIVFKTKNLKKIKV